MSPLRPTPRRSRPFAGPLDVRESTRLALDVAHPLRAMEVALPEALGCIAAVDIPAPTDHPLLSTVTCDGYAVRSTDLADGPRSLRVLTRVVPGDSDPAHVVRGSAARVYSGVPLPLGADMVVPADLTDRGSVTVAIGEHGAALPAGSGVRQTASAFEKGSVAISAGTRLTPRHIALVAELGLSRILVHPRPRVAVIAVGDEVVDLGVPAMVAQRHDSTGVLVSSLLEEVGATTFRVVGVADSVPAISESLDDQVVRADVIVMLGGLSDTGRDVVPEALVGVGEFQLAQVSSAPSLYFGAGRLGERLRARPVFALPGDPAKALLAAEAFVLPALRTMMGASRRTRPAVHAQAVTGWESPKGRREFVGVRVSGAGSDTDPYRARVTAPSDAMDLGGLARANALAIVPEDVTTIRPGDLVACSLLDE